MAGHDHIFGQDQLRPGERRTRVVIALTAVMMVVEIAAGILFGSMALLADGLHMASHAVALAIAAFAYVYARRHAHDRRYTFGTGKVNALGGFAGAVLLAAFALLMAGESVHRLLRPLPIQFNQAILVAVLGLIVNGLSVVILGQHHDREEDHERHHHDHNLRSAYLHVLADALTSVTAIVALLAGKYFGWNWMDPAMGILGSLLVARWSAGLLRATSGVLLDRQAEQRLVERIRACLESQDNLRVVDLHVWCIGPSLHAAEIAIATPNDARGPEHYRALLPPEAGLAHVTIEIQPASSSGGG